MRQTFLAFDLGTTALKTALISADGCPLAIHTGEYTPRAPRPDWAEMPAELYWHTAVQGTRAVFAEAKVSPSTLAGIGFSSQGQTFVPIDLGGKPLHDAIVWVDNRAQDVADEWQSAWLTRESFQASSGYPWIPACLTVFKIAWLARNAPAAHQAWKFLCLPDFFIYRMTGETVTDYVTACMSGMFHLESRDWDPHLLAAAGITRDQLPQVLAPGLVAGKLRAAAAAELGVSAGIPVCTGANDNMAGAVGAGNVCPGVVTETTGTALALIATTPGLLRDPQIIAGKHAVQDFSYAMTMATTSAIVLKWFRDLFDPNRRYREFLQGIEEIPCGCEGLTVVPHFMGTSMPTFDPRIRGAFVGLTLGHTRSHIARAIMESCACLLKESLVPISSKGLAAKTIRSLGGAARSDAWLQMKADMLNVVVERPACSEAALLGAATFAAAATGHFSSITEAAEKWYKRERCFEPDPSRHGQYSEVYDRYLDLMRRLYGDIPSGVPDARIQS